MEIYAVICLVLKYQMLLHEKICWSNATSICDSYIFFSLPQSVPNNELVGGAESEATLVVVNTAPSSEELSQPTTGTVEESQLGGGVFTLAGEETCECVCVWVCNRLQPWTFYIL